MARREPRIVPLAPSQHFGFLDTNDDVVDLSASDVDIALRYGKPGWGNLHHELVTREELIVVASPTLVGAAALPMAPMDIANLPLLHDEFILPGIDGP